MAVYLITRQSKVYFLECFSINSREIYGRLVCFCLFDVYTN
ncbi:unnamed protein product [Arabidopsis halleri]